jgi:hypothetical protein
MAGPRHWRPTPSIELDSAVIGQRRNWRRSLNSIRSRSDVENALGAAAIDRIARAATTPLAGTVDRGATRDPILIRSTTNASRKRALDIPLSLPRSIDDRDEFWCRRRGDCQGVARIVRTPVCRCLDSSRSAPLLAPLFVWTHGLAWGSTSGGGWSIIKNQCNLRRGGRRPWLWRGNVSGVPHTNVASSHGVHTDGWTVECFKRGLDTQRHFPETASARRQAIQSVSTTAGACSRCSE